MSPRKSEQEKGQWVLLSKATHYTEAEIIKGFLETKGIAVKLLRSGLDSAYALTIGPLANVEVLVPRVMEARARELLSEWRQREASEMIDAEAVADPDQEREGICLLIDEMRDEIVTFLQDLVRTESVNPPGHTRRVIRVIADKLDSFGADYDILSEDESRQNLVARLNRGGRPALLFNSHVDTVPEGDISKWVHGPFSGEIVENLLYGRGAADAKASVAAMVMAAKALAISGLNLSGSLEINPVCDEETGGHKGTRYLLEQGEVQPDYVVVGEITGNRVAVAEKGIIQLELKTQGKSAHASTPWDGINAVDNMLTLYNRIRTYFTENLQDQSHPLTPPPSINLGLIRGGVKSNMVPESCTASIDFRPIPGMDTDQIAADLEGLLLESAKEGIELEYSLEILGYPFETDPDAAVVLAGQRAVRFRGLDDERVGYSQVSDGRFFAERDIPTLILGPGDPARAHTHNEFVPVDDLVEAVKIYALIALELLRYQNENGDQAEKRQENGE